MKAPTCRLCEHAHWNNEPHVFATNNATNNQRTKVATNKAGESATNKAAQKNDNEVGMEEVPTTKLGAGVLPKIEKPLARSRSVGGPGRAESDASSSGGGLEPKTANRRSKSAYNAYQREYMRKKRAPHPLDGMAVLVDKTD